MKKFINDLKLTNREWESLHTHAKQRPQPQRKPYPEEVQSAGSVEFDVIRPILNRIGITQFSHPTIYRFNSVGMHTDCVSQETEGTLIILLSGSGCLNYFKSKLDYRKLIISDRQLVKGSIAFFPDKLPHSFVKHTPSKEPCVACIIDVPLTHAKHLL